jgi:hypothetical protein
MKCALCKSEESHEESHIIPAFIYRWLKESSPTGFLRNTESPNQRIQDGVKLPLLGSKCEDDFCVLEKKFAETVFNEVHRKGKNELAFEYSDWLSKFCVSISWRTLTYITEKGKINELPHKQGSLLAEPLEIWRKYLLGEASDIGPFRQHFIILDAPVSGLTAEDLVDMAIYIKRAVDFDTIHSTSPDECYIFSKICDILIVGTILDPNPKQWAGTEVKLNGGSYHPRDMHVSGCFTTFLNTALEDIRASRKKISAGQLKKMDTALARKLHKNPKGSLWGKEGRYPYFVCL